MNRTSLQIKVLYNDMGKAEKKVADCLLAHPGEILPLSIVELAERCHSSEATIVRFAKRLGFSGYQGLKISLAQESRKTTISATIHRDDDCDTIFEKVCNDIYLSLEKTKKVMDGAQLKRAAECLHSAKKIVIFGLGNSAAIAMDAGHKFLRAGCNAVAYTDNHMQAIAAAHLTAGDVAIGISHSGSSRDIVDALKLAKEHGAATICITSYGKSPITKQSDIVLFTDADETKYSILALNSRIAQLAMIDALYFYLVYHLDEQFKNSLQDTEHALLSKKY